MLMHQEKIGFKAKSASALSIHMNGRVYDYNMARFLSVDPFIQEPGNSQSLNPYSYILNNPLSGTDPSGYMYRNTVAPAHGTGGEGEAPVIIGSATGPCKTVKECLQQKKSDKDKAAKDNVSTDNGADNRQTDVSNHEGTGGPAGPKAADSSSKLSNVSTIAKVKTEKEKLEQNPDLTREIDNTISDVTEDVRDYSDKQGLLYDPARANTVLGSVIRENDGKFKHTRSHPHAIDGAEPNYDSPDASFFSHFISGLEMIKNASAIVLAIPTMAGESYIVNREKSYINLSNSTKSPVIVTTTQRDRGTAYLFNNGKMEKIRGDSR